MSGHWLKLNDVHVRCDAQTRGDSYEVARALGNLFEVHLQCCQGDDDGWGGLPAEPCRCDYCDADEAHPSGQYTPQLFLTRWLNASGVVR